MITDWVCPPVEGVRGGKAARSDEDALVLFTASAGRQIVETSGETVVLQPGSVLMLSTRTAGRFAIPEQIT
ncbi:hypothetical protein, partial [Streptomyces scabiei]|uniref:hypothetical protein n=1 Tax=Streptomyces scabiei TaxID=1930 RepID=UPI0038F6F3C2